MAAGVIAAKVGGFVAKMAPKIKGFVGKTKGLFKKIGGFVGRIKDRRKARISGTVGYVDDNITVNASTNNTAAAYAQYLPYVGAAIALYLIVKK